MPIKYDLKAAIKSVDIDASAKPLGTAASTTAPATAVQPAVATTAAVTLGNGTIVHVSGELFKMMTGVNMLHVPYRGAGPAVVDLIAGQVQVMFATMPSSIEFVRSGKLRALAVPTLKIPDMEGVARSHIITRTTSST